MYRIVENPHSGTVTPLEPGQGSVPDSDRDPRQVIYTPNPGYAGTDSFQFVVNDGVSDSEPATVTIRVIDYPRGQLSNSSISRKSYAAARFADGLEFINHVAVFMFASIITLLIILKMKNFRIIKD
jgi:hypothetical protein